MKLKHNYEEILKKNGFENVEIENFVYENTLHDINFSINDFIKKYLSEGKYKITNTILNKYFENIRIDFCKKDYTNYCEDYLDYYNTFYTTKNGNLYNTSGEGLLEIITNELEIYNLIESLNNYVVLLKEFEHLYYSQDFYFFDNLSNFIKTISEEFREHIYDATENLYNDVKNLIFID